MDGVCYGLFNISSVKVVVFLFRGGVIMHGTELEEVSCFADGHLCISNNNLILVFSGKEVVSSRKNLFLNI